MRRSSDLCLSVFTQGGSAFPGFPSDRFSPLIFPVGTYSGGTVRDSHPVILFSNPSQSTGAATQWVIKLSQTL